MHLRAIVRLTLINKNKLGKYESILCNKQPVTGFYKIVVLKAPERWSTKIADVYSSFFQNKTYHRCFSRNFPKLSEQVFLYGHSEFTYISHIFHPLLPHLYLGQEE